MNIKNKHDKSHSFLGLLLCTLWASHAYGASPEKSVAVPEKGGAIVEGFQLIADTDTNTFAPSTPIVVTVSLKNTKDRVLATTVSYPEADYELVVTNLKGDSLPLTLYGQRRKRNNNTFFGIGSVEIAPGQQVVDTFTINRFFDMTEAGDYNVKVTRRSIPKLDKSGFVPIESNVIRLKVDDSVKPAPAPQQSPQNPKDKSAPPTPAPK